MMNPVAMQMGMTVHTMMAMMYRPVDMPMMDAGQRGDTNPNRSLDYHRTVKRCRTDTHARRPGC
jgi:hypothetical protein